MTVNTTHTQPVWTEIEYTALCKNPYLSTPFYVPKESKVFQCKEDGSRKEARMLYLVFKAANAPEDAEWEDDPMPGEILVGVLDDDDEGEVDLSSKAYQIWKNATDANPELKTIIPALSNVIYSTKSTESPINEGVITYAKTPSDNDMLLWMDKTGEIKTYSQSTILKALACSIDEPGLARAENHHDLVGKSIDQISSQEIKVSGTLGKRFSTKYRIYTLLEAFCKEPSNGLFVTEDLKLAMDDIYNYPLKENARILLNRQLKKGTSAMEIVDLVKELRNEEELSIKKDEEETRNKEPQIICSMGLRNI